MWAVGEGLKKGEGRSPEERAAAKRGRDMPRLGWMSTSIARLGITGRDACFTEEVGGAHPTGGSRTFGASRTGVSDPLKGRGEKTVR
jgi:hypothetical protein